jgi:hypothetical protein
MTLPSFLNRTPEQIRDEQHRQQMLRDLHLKGASQTPAEQRIARAMMAEDAIRKNLALLLPGSDAHRATEIELAEVLAEQGKFREAAAINPEFEKFVTAVDRPDDEFCDCPPDTAQGRNAQGAVTVPVPNTFVAYEVPKDGKIVPLVQCAKCGHLNATEMHDNSNQLADVER